MDLDEKIKTFLAQTESKASRSKLEPYDELIRTLRKRHWTYRQIAAALRSDFGLTVCPSTIHFFVHARSKRSRGGPTDAPTASPTLGDPGPQNPSTVTRRRFHLDV